MATIAELESKASEAEQNLAGIRQQYDTANSQADAARAAANSALANLQASGLDSATDANYQSLATRSRELSLQVQGLSNSLYQAKNQVAIAKENLSREQQTQQAAAAEPAAAKKEQENAVSADPATPVDPSKTQEEHYYNVSGRYKDDKGTYNVYVQGGDIAASDDNKPTAPPQNAPTSQQKKNEGPGQRIYNPLSKLSSYTYNLSLYMITPEAYEKFVNEGHSDPKDYRIVAQSGGVNRSGSNTALFERDYYIDDLIFKTLCSTRATSAPTVDSIEFEFKIYEPYGFSFMSELKNAAIKVMNKSTIPGVPYATHHMQQIYMLGIKFYGYDNNGDVINSDKYGGTAGNEKDALFPRYFPITITKMGFKVDGKVTVYTVKAQPLSTRTAFSVTRGLIKNPITITGGTVGEILSGEGNNNLQAVFNSFEDALSKKIPDTAGEQTTTKNHYEIAFDAKGGQDIKNAVLVLPADMPKSRNYKSPVSSVKSTTESNEKTANAGLTIDPNKRTFSIPMGTPIIQAMELIIAQSSYVRESLRVLYSEESQPQTEDPNSGAKELKWFNITPIAKVNGYDKTRNSFTYNIKYLINEYLIPNVKSPYINKSTFYHGPHKRYKYSYTGKNNEILNYEQVYDSLYYMNSIQQGSNDASIPTPVNMFGKQSEVDSASQNIGGQAVASTKSGVYSPLDNVTARISILGDPDFIMPSIGMDYTIYKKFYGPDFSVDPHAGQVFIEIDFNEAKDYDTNTGVMFDLNKKLEIYKYPPELRDKVEGITYMIKDVTSTFSRGKFTQDLNLMLWSQPINEAQTKAALSGSQVNGATSSLDETKRSILNSPTFAQSQPKTYDAQQVQGFPSAPQAASQNPTNQFADEGSKFMGQTNASVLASIQGQRTIQTPQGTQTADDDASLTSTDVAYLNGSGFNI
jgi:hypothetical protein